MRASSVAIVIFPVSARYSRELDFPVVVSPPRVTAQPSGGGRQPHSPHLQYPSARSTTVWSGSSARKRRALATNTSAKPSSRAGDFSSGTPSPEMQYQGLFRIPGASCTRPRASAAVLSNSRATRRRTRAARPSRRSGEAVTVVASPFVSSSSYHCVTSSLLHKGKS